MFRRIATIIVTALALTFALGGQANAASKPGQPKHIIAFTAGASQAEVSGDPVKGAKFYTIKLATNKKMKNPEFVMHYTVAYEGEYYAAFFGGLKGSTTYYATVEVSDAAGNRLSKVSSVKKMNKTKASDPIHDPGDDDDGDN